LNSIDIADNLGLGRFERLNRLGWISSEEVHTYIHSLREIQFFFWIRACLDSRDRKSEWKVGLLIRCGKRVNVRATQSTSESKQSPGQHKHTTDRNGYQSANDETTLSLIINN